MDFLEDFLGRIFERNYLSHFNVEGIDLFVKILSKSRRKEDKLRALVVQLQVHHT